MKLLEKILLATDFSKTSAGLVENAIRLAKILQSKITLVHVIPDDFNNENIRFLLSREVKKQLASVNKKIESAGIKTDKPVLEYGIHFDKINQLANSINANLILIGSGDKLKSDVYKLGITAEKLIRKSNKPVWVIENDAILKIEKILCPVDFSSESERALKNAITIARRFNAELKIFSTYNIYNADSFRLNVDWDEINTNARVAHAIEFNAFLERFNLTDLKLAKETLGGDPAKEILAAVSRDKFDLLIMGSTGKSGLRRILLGSVTEKVIREVPCSFITLKSEDVINLKLDNRIRDLESHYNTAMQLMKDGYFVEATNEFNICLNINDMHIRSLIGMAEVHEKLDDVENTKKYKDLAKEVLARIWDKKIENEVRRNYKL